jgi:glycosyltransferase involved in cell wall biosynthesis
VQVRVDWTRFWETVAESVEEARQPDERISTNDLPAMGCLVLLGAPGIGKSTEMQRLNEAAAKDGSFSDFIPVGRIPNSKLLESAILDSPSREAWLYEGARWSIFLDGLDESISKADDVTAAITSALRQLLQGATQLTEEIRVERLARLRLRVSCRTTEWSRSLQESLVDVWGEEGVRLYELTGLSRDDAALAATANGLTTEQWKAASEKLQQLNAESLLERPITLSLLLNTLRQDGELPDRQLPLYSRGVLAILEESNEVRRANNLVGILDPASRMMVAGRLAAAGIFSKTTSYWIGSAATAPSEAVVISEISGGREASFGSSFKVGDGELLDVLRTSLFATAGDATFVWAHHTFAEFLAAHYLVRHGLTADQLAEFFRNPADDELRIPPQLHETAAWVASMHPAFFRFLIAHEPDILLRSDVAGADPTDRAALVRELLGRYDRRELYHLERELSQRYAKLAYPTLLSDLLPYIEGKNRALVARRAAIDIAVECKLSNAGGSLVRLALDPAESMHLRSHATWAVSRIGDPKDKAGLRPLVIPGDPLDVDDELRGWALTSLWPGLMKFGEVLGALSPPKNDSLIGGYWSFLRYFEPGALSAQEAVSAIRWVIENASKWSEESFTFEPLATKLLIAAWQAADRPKALNAFADFVQVHDSDALANFSYSSNFNDFVTAFRNSPPGQRHSLAKLVLSRLSREGRSARIFLFGRWPIVTREDLGWLVELLRSSEDDISETVLVDTIVSLTAALNPEDYAFLWEAADSNEKLASALEQTFTVVLGTDYADWQKRSYHKQKDSEDEEEKPEAFSMRQRLADGLASAEKDPCSWWQFNLLFALDEDGRPGPTGEFVPDLTRSPVWTMLGPEFTQRTVEAAARYLADCDLSSREWVGTNTFYRPAAAAYRAFNLLRSVQPERLDHLPTSAWVNWASALLAVSFNLEGNDKEVRRELVGKACTIAPKSVIRAMLLVFSRSSDDWRVREVLQNFDSLPTPALNALWRYATRERSTKHARDEIFRFLLECGYLPIRQALVDALHDENGKIPFVDRESFVGLLGKYLNLAPSEAWKHIYERRSGNSELVRDVLLANHGGGGLGNFPLQKLTAQQLAQLYEVLNNLFPGLPERRRGGFVTAEDQIQFTRNAIPRELANRGSSEAVDALQQLASDAADRIEIDWYISEAKARWRERVWRSRSPAEAIASVASFAVLPPPRSVKAELEAAALDRKPVADEGVTPPQMALEMPKEPPPDARQPDGLRILAVATEWSPAHGGLSKFNRSLCSALVKAGCEVVCIAVEPTHAEIDDALKHGVKLVGCPADAGFVEKERLVLFDVTTLGDWRPQVVIGHDHVTGPAAHHIARRVVKPALYAHFVHTIPGEIEPFKTDDVGKGVARGLVKAETQRDECLQADVVITVGPRISWEITRQIGEGRPIIQVVPGLDEALQSISHDSGKLLGLDVLFQARQEDAHLKGGKLACDAIEIARSAGGYASGMRPQLIARGFSPDEADKEFMVLGDPLKLRNFVIARPYTTDLSALRADLSTASILVMPSFKEGFGLVALEAIAAGVPVLASSDSGIAQLLMSKHIKSVIGSLGADCILDVDVEDADQKWGEKIQSILADIDAAFGRADTMRKQLGSTLTWAKCAADFLGGITPLLS